MNPKRCSTGVMIALIILFAVQSASAVEVPFLDPLELSAGTPRPYGSVVADLDNDGDNDVVIISNAESSTSRMVKMMESNGARPPAFTLRAVSPGGFNYRTIALYPKGVAAARIDADEYPDVVSCSVGKVSWHRTRPGQAPAVTSFVNNVVYSDTTSGFTGSDFLSVAAADLNSDGRTDIVAANNTTDEILAWINEADPDDPEFIVWTQVTAATGVLEPAMVALADLNMDGHVDVVVADAEGDRLLWLRNDGGATPAFSTNEISAAEDGVRSVGIADLNLDGYPELFSASNVDGRIVWWANGGGMDPVFTPTDIATLDNVHSIVAYDVDRDGDTDVVAGTNDPANSGMLAWFDSDGAWPPTFQNRIIRTGGAVQSITMGDVDGDGDGDLLSSDLTDDALYYLENRLCAVDFPARFFASSQAWGADAVHAADLTGNGTPDIVAASFFSDPDISVPVNLRRDITWFANDGNTLPTLTESTIPIQAVGQRAQSVTTGDIDGDGDLDVVAASEAGNWIRWYANSGSGSPSFTPYDVTTTLYNARDAIVADVDGDGDADVVGASSSENKVAWYENDGSMTPVFTEHIVTRNARGAWSVFAGDLDGDGDMDLASASFNDGRIAWYENDGNQPPTWTEKEVYTPQETVTPAAIDVIGADLDRDGDIDLAAASVFQDKVAWYENAPLQEDPGSPGEDPPPPTIQFIERVVTMSDGNGPGYAEGASSVHAGDLDGDGDPDLVVTAALNDRLAWFESDGQAPATFFPRSISIDTQGARSAVAADLNRDGRLDIIAASAVDNSVSTFLSVVGDTCMAFDASRDGSMDAQELAWIGRSFGLIRDGESPPDEWWAEIDFDGNGKVDGVDLSILGSSGVWGRSVLSCSYTCNDD